MSHIEPFEIDEYRYVHTEPGDIEDVAVRKKFLDLCGFATNDWRSEGWRQCVVDTVDTVFGVFDMGGDLVATWGLYKVEFVDGDPNTVSAFPAPMFDNINARIPEPAYGPGDELINGDEIVAARSRSSDFWQRSFSIMEWMVMNPMPYEDSGEFVVDHWRFPLVSDGDWRQHEWYGVKEYFDLYCKLDVEFAPDAYGDDTVAIRTLDSWKSVDPDPSRARGSFYP